MGKKLIIKGADFSADAIPYSIVWNNEFVAARPSYNYFVCGNTDNNFVGLYYSEGATIDGIKLSLIPKTDPTSQKARNLQVGDKLKFAKVSTTSPYNKEVLAEVTLTQSHFNNEFIIVPIERVSLTSSEYIGVCRAEDGDTSIAIPMVISGITETTGFPSKWLNAAGTKLNSFYSIGMATYYIL